VVDSRLRRKYQAEPGRQEWITIVECVCADGGLIPPLIIFKGENLVTSWIPRDVANKWHFSCNSKGWTSNIHGEEWLKQCFDPATREKANGKKRLLICDGHDSHISAQFIRYALDNNIVVLLLPPHSSHILQPLDVGIFGPLKAAIGAQLSRLYATELGRLQKVEWIEKYMPARSTAITTRNILSGWRGSGLSPINANRILRCISSTISPPSSTTTAVTTPYLVTSSPPDSTRLHSANKAFNDALVNNSLATPLRQHGRRLSGIAEQLHASNVLLRKENSELKQVLSKRTERLSGKRLILKGQFIATTEVLQAKLAAAEHSTKQKKAKKPQKKVVSRVEITETEDEDTDEEVIEMPREMQDCIEVNRG
jgi:hypothetical protein